MPRREHETTEEMVTEPEPVPVKENGAAARSNRKRRRDSDEVMEEAAPAAVVVDGPENGTADAPMVDTETAADGPAAAEVKEEGAGMDGEITPVDGKAPTDDAHEDDAITNLGSRGKTPAPEPTRLILRSNPGLTHVDLGIGQMPDDPKKVYAFAEQLEQPYVDPLNNANVVPLSRLMASKVKYADIRWDMYGQDRRAPKRVRLSRASDWKLEVPSRCCARGDLVIILFR